MNIKSLVLCLCLSSSWASAASAAVLSAGDVIKLDRSGAHGGARGGGEFTIWKLTSTSPASDVWTLLGVQTYCLEFNEHIVLGQKLLVGAISDRAVLGGIAGQVNSDPNPLLNGADPIDARTAYLYQNFVTDSLGSTGFDANSDAWSNALQEAIWHLEQEVSAPVTTEAQKLLDFANSYTNQDVSSVFVLNLFTLDARGKGFDPYDNRTWDAVKDYRRQDQLFYAPPTAPEPSSAALWLTAMCLLAGRARVRPSKSDICC